MRGTKYRNIQELPLVLTPQDVQDVLGISRNNAYALVHSKGFPVIRIGKLYRINRDKFIQWMETTREVEIAC